MPLTFIYGGAGTGKSTYCITDMQTLSAQGKKAMMIVPEQFAHSAEIRLIENVGYISEEVQVTSFKRLAQKTLQKNGRLKNSISSIGKSMLLSKAILQNAGALSLYKNTAKKPGFIDSMLTFIAECKRSMIEPARLLPDNEQENSLLSLKMRELSLIFETYQQNLQTNYTDSEEYVALLADLIKEKNLFADCTIFIDEFFRFTPAEYACILSFLSSGASVHITLGTPDPHAGGVFEPVSATAYRLNAMAREACLPVTEAVYLKEKHRFSQSAELLHLESEYHHYPPILYKEETHDITLYIAPDIYTETQVLAASIRRAVTEGGLRYKDIAILSGNPELYEDMIKTVFPVYDIPVYIDRKRALLSHPLIVMLTAVFELMAKGIETEPLLVYMKCGYCGLTEDETDILENFALSGNLHRRDWLDDHRFFERADSVFYESEDYEFTHAEEAKALLDSRDKILKPLLRLRTALAESRLVDRRAEALFNFFEEINLREAVEKEAEELIRAGCRQEAEEHSSVYNVLISLLNELVTCLGDEKIGLRRLTDIITAGLSQCEMATIPPSYDQIFLGDINRSLMKNVKLLFIIGANDGTFPPAANGQGLVTDSERLLLKEKGLELGPDSKTLNIHNQYVLYSAMHISTQKICISYPVADVEGKGLRPSPLVSRLKKIFPCLTVTEHLQDAPDPACIIAGKAAAWQYVLEHFSDDTPKIRALKQYLAQDEAFAHRIETASRYQNYSIQPGNISSKTAHRLYGHTLRGSVTQLEKYAGCPFSYFLRYGLKAKERKILKVEAPDVGSLMHKIIELASARIVRDGVSFGALTEAYIAQLAEEIVEEIFAHIFIRNMYGENRLQALIKRLKAQTAKMLKIISTHVARGSFEPCAFEVAFAENGELKPVTVPLPTGDSVVLTGRIDRIDKFQQNASVYIKIIDYKTGSKSFRLSDVYKGLSLQLAVYLIAATGADSTSEKALPAGMFYFRLAEKTVSATNENTEEALLKQFKMSGLVLKDADIIRAMDSGISGFSSILPARINQNGSISEKDGCYATMEQFNRLKKHVYNTVSAIGQEILQGKVSVNPCMNKDGLPCRYCEYHPVCAFNTERDAYRTAPPLKDEAVWEALYSEEA